MAEPASTATAAALKTRREMDDLCVMVESSKFIAEVQWSEFWGSTVETGTTDFSVSNYQIIFRGCRAPGQGVPGCVRATAQHAVGQLQGALDLWLKVCRLFNFQSLVRPEWLKGAHLLRQHVQCRLGRILPQNLARQDAFA